MYKDIYKSDVIPALTQKWSYGNLHQVPKLDKIVVSMGVGAAATAANASLLDNAAKELSLITGQKAAIRRAKKSVSAFKVRQGMPVGCMVTLRGERMYEFFLRLVKVALPQIRDFRGVNPNSFDGRGNFAFGLQEQIIFPEVSYDEAAQIRGMNIVVATTAKSDEEARDLLRLMGMPFREA